MDILDTSKRRELGEFVRAQRERLSPAALGLAPGPRRRTPGLRREELAQLSGVSVTWYTWIEQGRDVSISPAALGRLAVALRLSAAERAYLFDLAGKRDPDGAAAGEDAPVPAALDALVRGVPYPAYLLDRQWNALAWNAAAARLFIGWLDHGEDRNQLRYLFLAPAAQALIPDWAERARRVVAEFRVDYSHHLNDPGMRALVTDLSQRSPLFADLWHAHTVTARAGGERAFEHPTDGPLRYEQLTFALAGQTDVKLVTLVPIGVPTGPPIGVAAG
ncbi:helix-turn-helix transcriptional regulator [Nitrospirillum viridazoti]|uniref:XRE family transcriptional regulator n=1 Tax=Nitrospirillum viridazoti CBAmc TaxID=1441467 RepID=A0A248JQW5_9PROT|nr:helix-turn-helix transcriptional regulator [Nitrospirillum amazonense]ASG21097.1 XRE family transcriptional regulator [Nitrospirillum amazonense CBAmc]TWB26155.1 helix-turn-helix protein [Nitrospirillum amazonense]